MKVHTPGAVVTTADVLMTVVPDGSGIEIDALVLNGDIGFVAEGQPVEVKLEAFPFTRYGLVKGGCASSGAMRRPGARTEQCRARTRRRWRRGLRRISPIRPR